ncbi:MAG: hypothetical protein IJB17_04280 [Oscillospiraceae bacterium]|nr:hypothetical protein [Oscillospiraceae bacterium]
MSYEDYSFANPYITPGEQILWRGKPEQGNLVTGRDAFMIPFSIVWCGFAVFWFVSVLVSGAPVFFALFGIPFVVMGLYLVFGRFLWTAHMRKQTQYVITNRKIIRKRGQKIDIQDHTKAAIHVTVHSNGCGTIRIGAEGYYGRQSYDLSGNPYGVFLIENVAQVARVQQLLYSAREN